MIFASSVTKRFGNTVALDHVDFSAAAGEIHAVLGENGAGKTTLMNVISGRVRPDSGSVALDGRDLPPGDTRAAHLAGIASVNQSPLVFERMSWAENLALGVSSAASGNSVVERARELARSLGFPVPSPTSSFKGATIGDRARMEILRALCADPRVLILDEPTGLLAPAELEPFLDLIRRLRSQGRIVILITHKLREALAVADRVTVMREGKVVFKGENVAGIKADLARHMIGEVEPPIPRRASSVAGEPLMELSELTVSENGQTVIDGVSLRLFAGEIFGIAGVDGNGQAELVETLAGLRLPVRGTIRSNGRISVIPQNRDLDGLILNMELQENLLLAEPLREHFTGYGAARVIQRSEAMTFACSVIDRFKIRAPGPRAQVAALSGGNRQRLQVARALESGGRIIVAHNVTRGLDPAATASVHRLFEEFAAKGNCVMLISSDLDELLDRCDRLAVMSRGRVRELPRKRWTAEQLGLMMAGQSVEQE